MVRGQVEVRDIKDKKFNSIYDDAFITAAQLFRTPI